VAVPTDPQEFSFLRELIASASDANDRLRLELPARSRVSEEEGPLPIRVGFDADPGRLTDSPACIVASESDPGPFMTQRLSGSLRPAQPVLEITPHHPLADRLHHQPADPASPSGLTSSTTRPPSP
jgi:HSP90 family molecular chaperone